MHTSIIKCRLGTSGSAAWMWEATAGGACRKRGTQARRHAVGNSRPRLDTPRPIIAFLH